MRIQASAIEKRIGARITEIRISNKLTQSQLAEKVNVSNETISRLERGISIPSLKTLEKIAESLKIPLSSFFDFEGVPSNNPLFERELSKFISFMRTLNLKEISFVHKVVKTIYKNMKI